MYVNVPSNVHLCILNCQLQNVMPFEFFGLFIHMTMHFAISNSKCNLCPTHVHMHTVQNHTHRKQLLKASE